MLSAHDFNAKQFGRKIAGLSQIQAPVSSNGHPINRTRASPQDGYNVHSAINPKNTRAEQKISGGRGTAR